MTILATFTELLQLPNDIVDIHIRILVRLLVDRLSQREIDRIFQAIDIEVGGGIHFPRDESEYEHAFEDVVDYLFSIDDQLPWPEPQTDQEYNAEEEAIRILAKTYVYDNPEERFDPRAEYDDDDWGVDDPSNFYGVE